MSKHPKPNSPDAPVWNMNEKQPYAGKSVTSVFFVVLLFATAALTIYWYMGSEKDPAGSVADEIIAAGKGNPGRTGVDDLANNALDFLGADSNDISAGQAALMLEKQAEAIASMDDGYQHSVNDVVGSEVVGRSGNKAGKIHDIIVDVNTGEAQAVIINELDGKSYTQNLKKLIFNDVTKQAADGNILLSVTDDAVSQRKEFTYSEIKENFVSLRHLKDAQILDDQGNVSGEVTTVIYKNANAQKIYFTLAPSLDINNKSKRFGIPYENVKIVKSNDGYDIKLTKEQTEALARQILK